MTGEGLLNHRRPLSVAKEHPLDKESKMIQVNLCKKQVVSTLAIIVLVISALAVNSAPSAQHVSGSDGHAETMGVTTSRSFVRQSVGPEMAHTDEAAMDMAEEDYEDHSSAQMRHKSMSHATMGETLLDSLEQSESTQGTASAYVSDRMLVHSGNVQLQSYDVKSLADDIEDLIKEEGQGYVESRSTDRIDHPNRFPQEINESRLVVNFQLRVASKTFHDSVKSICDMVDESMVISVSTNSNDVTDEFVDASSRADTLDASRKALKHLLSAADNVNDVMQVQRELNRLTQQYESQRARALVLKKNSNLSALYVRLEEMPKPSRVDVDQWWNPSASMWLACEHMNNVATLLGDTLVYVATWAIPCSILLVCILFVVPKKRER